MRVTVAHLGGKAHSALDALDVPFQVYGCNRASTATQIYATLVIQSILDTQLELLGTGGGPGLLMGSRILEIDLDAARLGG